MYLHSVTLTRSFDIEEYRLLMCIELACCKDEAVTRKDDGEVDIDKRGLTMMRFVLPDPCTEKQLAEALMSLAQRVREMEW